MKNKVLVKKEWLIKKNKCNIEDLYDIDNKNPLGSGGFAIVLKGKLKSTNMVRAIKKINKNKVHDKQDFLNQIQILQSLDHPNIIKLYQTFQDDKNFYIVTEQDNIIRLCTGGELFDKILEKGSFSQVEARHIFIQIIQALNYLHQKGIAHRDLKPQNFLLQNKTPESPIKIIDFGLSFRFKNREMYKKSQKNMATLVGTSYYMAPEIIDCKSNYNHLCDVWSAGVILYILLTGIPPFNGQTDQQILQQLSNVSKEGKQVIKKTLTPPNARPNAKQILNFQWMKNELDPNKKLNLNFDALKKYVKNYKLKRITLTYMATQISQQDIMQLSKVFKALDTDGDGMLTVDQLKVGLQQSKIDNSDDIEKILLAMDTDNSGKIDYTQFLAANIGQNIYLKEENLKLAFKNFDVDGNGKISRSQLKQIIGRNYQLPEQLGCQDQNFWDELIKEADINGDGQIDYKQFVQMMKKK